MVGRQQFHQQAVHIGGSSEQARMALHAAENISIFIMHPADQQILAPRALFGGCEHSRRLCWRIQINEKKADETTGAVKFLANIMVQTPAADALNNPLKDHKPDVAVNHPGAHGVNERFAGQQIAQHRFTFSHRQVLETLVKRAVGGKSRIVTQQIGDRYD